MSVIKKFFIIFVVFLSFSSFSWSVIAVNVGVKPGHWAKYKIESVAFGGQYSYIKLSISSVQGTKISGTVTYEYPYGTLPTTVSFQYDISTGMGFTTLPYWIIPANSKVGDTILVGYVGFEIKGMETRSYAGASRDVVWAESYTNKLFWDRETGILVEETMGGVTLFKLTETNIWGAGIFDVSSPLFWVLIIIVIVVAIVVVFVVMRMLRKKKAPPTAVAPAEEKRSADIKYCVKCGASMSSDATFCPKCGHEQPKA